MKLRMIVLIVIVMCLTACNNGNNQQQEAENFSLSSDQQKIYNQEIYDILYSFYWRYDENSILYFGGTVPTEAEVRGSSILEASMESGFDLKKYSGKETVIATVDLLHFNGEKAGRAYIYFIKDNVAGIYYSGGYKNDIFSMHQRNVYMADGEFQFYESDSPMGRFIEKKTVFPVNGFISNGKDERGDTLMAAIENEKLSIYRYRNGLSKLRTISLTEGELAPTSAVFIPSKDGTGDSMAVLLSTISYTDIEGDMRIFTSSEKVIFLDSTFRKTNVELVLPSTQYTSISMEDDMLVLANGNMLEYYANNEGSWEKQSQYYLNHGVISFKISDLDGDGVMEYLMSDGMDFYVYHKQEKIFKNIWRTHLSIVSLMGSIYTGDLNRDGVKEIYLCDNTGTAIRYILTDKGLVSQNEDIAYGDRIYAFDFNGDGIDDYVKIVDIEKMTQLLYLGE